MAAATSLFKFFFRIRYEMNETFNVFGSKSIFNTDNVPPGELPITVCIIKLIFSRVIAPYEGVLSSLALVFEKNGGYK